MTSRSPILIPVPDELHGPRVVVRCYRPEDAQAFYEAADESRAHLNPYESWVNDYTSVDQAIIHVNRCRARWIVRQEFAAGIFDKQTGRFLGAAGIHGVDWERRVFEIGYWVRATEQGKGYITEAVRLLTTLAFERFGARRVEMRMNSRNERSWRVPERLGFKLEGVLRNATPDPDKPGDERIYGMIPEDFAAQAW
ncbi:MAG TPA: GNAT family protein [Symbiobacteriaceae bacterium]|nr:GNAT family protein [Symbiobacteriaceae bacterium]